MLTRTILSVLVIATFGSLVTVASADPARVCEVKDHELGVCLRYGGSTPAPGGGHENPDRGRRKTHRM